MEKLVYLLWGADGQSGDSVRDALLAAAPALTAAGALGIALNVRDSQADFAPPVPEPEGESLPIAQVSLWLDCHDRRAPCEEILAQTCSRRAAYLVSEALYRDYGGNEHAPARDWPDGQRSPGVLVLTLLERPEHLDRASWLAHWHGVQSPVSEALQPRTRYVRNEVIRALDDDAPPWEGIVEECWPSAAHVTDPMLFYLANGSPERMREHVSRMMESVTAFLELPRIRCVPMSEFQIKSAVR
jgi:hypothetical protein